MKPKNIILIGLGPHARRIYYPLLEKYSQQYNIKIPLVVDLQSQQETICQYLSSRAMQPERLFLVDDEYRNNDFLDGKLQATLNQAASDGQIDGIIISTEPKAHKPYALWAIERDIDILMDKPITVPVGSNLGTASAGQIWQDYRQIEQRLEKSRSNLIVQCQRRNHDGYRLIKSYLVDFVNQFEIPVSFIDIYHADGMWAMPSELFQRENHPYKYGYGKLMHSGYHFVDLFAWMAEVNLLLEQKKPNLVDMYVKRFGAYDFLHQIGDADYKRLFETDRFNSYFEPNRLETAKMLGELDVFILCQLKRHDIVVTTASINLQQNSFCRRAWTDLPEDVYKGNGRVRHERLNIQIANLLNLQVHSYQSYEVGKQAANTTGAGHEDHFDIHIFRNSKIVGGKTLEKIRLGEEARDRHQDDSSYLGHNEAARERNFLDFLEGRTGVSYFASHCLTNKLLSKIYECITAENRRAASPRALFTL